MKKILAAALAILTISSVALVSCKKEQQPSNDGGNSGGDDIVFENPSNKNTDTDDNTESGTDTENKKPATKEFSDLTAAKTVYAMYDINIRKEPTDSATKKGVNAGTEMSATATNDVWYKVTYDGETWYVPCDYVANSKEATVFTDLAENERFTLTIKKSNSDNKNQVNLRKYPLFGDIERKTIEEDDITAEKPLTVIAKNGTGTWYKVTFDGQTYYLAITSATKPVLDGIPGGNGPEFVD